MRFPRTARKIRAVLLAASALVVASSCDENLPSGPATFAAQLKIVVPHDTVVVGDTSVAQAQAFDAEGRAINALNFAWSSADSATIGFATPTDSSDIFGRTRRFVSRKPGRAIVTLSLPDPRFVVSSINRSETAVVGGVRVLSTHDSTLTAVNDTGFAIAAGLVRANGALVTRVSQGLRWIHLGTHANMVGQGDTVRYIARNNGTDTLIALHDFCLANAKCADTVVVRVAQQLTLTLSARSFVAWSFGDSLGPTVTLADRRGNGLPGASIRLIPATPLDSLIVKTTAAIGVTNPTTGALAAPRLVSTGNGTAQVAVVALGGDNSVVATDAITETVRQVARHVAVEPLRAVITSIDSIPIRPVARDARGAPILDATITIAPVGIAVNGGWTGPTVLAGPAIVGTITPTLTGIALPQNNPLAPQIPVAVDPSLISVVPETTVVAGTTNVPVGTVVLDSLGQVALGKWVRFGVSFGAVPDSVQVDQTGTASTTWTAPDSAANYTLTGLRGALTPLTTLADSAGRIVIRRSVTVKADVPSPLRTTMAISATTMAVGTTATVTVKVNDRFGNPVKTATPADFVIASNLAAGGGTFNAGTCTLGVCTVTYTAPAAPVTDVISVKMGAANVLNSPITLTITP